MSELARNWVEDHSPTTGTDFRVLLALARNADARGENSWPAVPTLARRARCHRATVQRALRRLEEMRPPAIEKTGVASSGTFIYRIVMERSAAPPAAPVRPEMSLRGPGGPQASPKGRTPCRDLGVQSASRASAGAREAPGEQLLASSDQAEISGSGFGGGER